MNEAEQGGGREHVDLNVASGWEAVNQNTQGTGGWGTGDWTSSQSEQQRRQWEALPPQSSAFSTATNPRATQPPRPMTSPDRRQGEEPIQWASTIFRNTLGEVTPRELRQQRLDESQRPEHTHTPRARNALITNIRTAGLEVDLEHDDELPMEARIIIEDLLFELEKKESEITYLRKRVGDLRKEAKVHKRADSDEKDRRPNKRHETERKELLPSMPTSRPNEVGWNQPSYGPPMGAKGLYPDDAMMRPPYPSSTGRGQTITRWGDPHRQSEPRRRPEPTREPGTGRREPPRRPDPFMINGRPYEESVRVTPPGPFRPQPHVVKQHPIIHDTSPPDNDNNEDPYHWDESDGEEGPPDPALMSTRTMEDDGRVPDFWGVRRVSDLNRFERDNSFRNMLSRNVYFSTATNIVFAGQSATEASRLESQGGDARRAMHDDSQVYARVTRGIPMNPFEVKRLITVARDSRRFSQRDRAEAYVLLSELRAIALRVMPMHRDAAMNFVIDMFDPSALYSPPPERFRRAQITRASTGGPQPMGNAPLLSDSMDIDTYGFHLLIHNRPGSVSPASGIAMDYAFRVGRRSVFGYVLCRLLAPTDKEALVAFRRQFAFLVSLPRRYREAIVDYDRASPQTPFMPQVGPTFTLRRARIDSSQARNLTLQDITNVLIDNRVPPEWVDHAYAYGVIFLNGHYSGSVIHQTLLDVVDNERLTRLRAYGVPPPIPAWDGWRHPSEGEVTHLHQVMEVEESRSARSNSERNRINVPVHRQGLDAPAWLLVGQDGLVEYLTHRPRQTAEEYASNHPIDLPVYAELTQLPPPSAPSLSGNPLAEPASIDADMGTVEDTEAPPNLSRDPIMIASANADAPHVLDAPLDDAHEAQPAGDVVTSYPPQSPGHDDPMGTDVANPLDNDLV